MTVTNKQVDHLEIFRRFAEQVAKWHHAGDPQLEMILNEFAQKHEEFLREQE